MANFTTITPNRYQAGAVLDNAVLGDISNNTHHNNDLINEGGSGGGTEIAIAIIKDVKPVGTLGGDSPAKIWTQRDLNVIEGDLSFAALANNAVTLQPGKYIIEAHAPSVMVEMTQMRMSVAGTIYGGTTEYSHGSYGSAVRSWVLEEINIASESLVFLEHIGNKEMLRAGLGLPKSWGEEETYAVMKITKIG